MRLRDRTGPLAERDFRLLFSATMITTAGDRLAAIALAFAVLGLHGAGATQLGIVLAARQVAQMGIVLFGGVFSDRLPRHHVIVVAEKRSRKSRSASGPIRSRRLTTREPTPLHGTQTMWRSPISRPRSR